MLVALMYCYPLFTILILLYKYGFAVCSQNFTKYAAVSSQDFQIAAKNKKEPVGSFYVLVE